MTFPARTLDTVCDLLLGAFVGAPILRGNLTVAGASTLASTNPSDGSTGSRTLQPNGEAWATKITATAWTIHGRGLT